jgi:uncharacterized protein
MINQNIPGILAAARTIAVVGLSQKPYRTSFHIAKDLLRHGYTVVPVNPSLAQWEGLHAYPDLASIPIPVDIVNIFRITDAVPAIVDQAIGIGAKVIWMQSGIIHESAAATAEASGLQVVMDRCISVELAMK